MIVDLIDKLIDRLIQLREKHVKMKKNLFDNYIQPAFEQFETVHKNYLETFRSYRELVKDMSGYDGEIEPICDQIRTDNLFTEDKRNKLVSMFTASKASEIETFVRAIFYYLIGSIEQASGSEFGDDIFDRIDRYYLSKGGGDGFLIPARRTQYYRTSLINDLSMLKGDFLLENEKKSQAVRNIELKVQELQDNYSRVVDAYTALKQAFLREA